MKLVIGITGHPLAGKETAADALAKFLEKDGHSVSRHRFSDILRDTLDIWDIPHGRDNEQKMAIVMNMPEAWGEGTLSHAMKARLAKNAADVGILDGVRWLSDEKMLREFPEFGIKSLILYVHASPERRYERLKQRARAGEHVTSWEEFMRQERVKTEVYISEIGGRADASIDNDHDDPAKLQESVAQVYARAVKPLL